MLWRTHYETKAVELERVPALTGVNLDGDPFVAEQIVVVVVASSVPALIKLDVWRRLVESRFGSVSWFAVGVFGAVGTEKQLRAAVPASRHASTFVWAESAAWKELSEPGGAAILRRERTGLFMRDLPTEDAWQFFGDEIQNELDLRRAEHLEG
jgi:hypothetical protein